MRHRGQQAVQTNPPLNHNRMKTKYAAGLLAAIALGKDSASLQGQITNYMYSVWR
jgi:hypothetical protein